MKRQIKYVIKKIGEILKDNNRWIILLVGGVALLALFVNIKTSDIDFLDVKCYEIITSKMSDPLTIVAKTITNIANPVILLLVAGVLFLVVEKKKNKFSIVCNLGIAAILNIILKSIIQRPRPIGHRLIDESGYSFPSGHSMVSMAFYGYLVYLIVKNVKNKYLRAISSCILLLLILFIGLSRIYLGVHYTSDVIGGFIVAILYLLLYTGIIKRI